MQTLCAMGVAQSQPSTTPNPPTGEGAAADETVATSPPPPPPVPNPVDEDFIAKLQQVSDLVAVYNNNNPLRLKEVLGDSDSRLIGLIDRSIELHTKLFESAGLQPPSSTDGDLSDERLQQLIGQFVNNDANAKAASLLDSPVFRANASLRSNIARIFDNMARVQAKYRYYEFKYVQLNVFVIGFTQHMDSVLRRFISNTTAAIEFRDRLYTTTISGAIQVLEDMTKSQGTTDLENVRRVQAIVQNLQTVVLDGQAELRDFLRSYQKSTVRDIVSYINETERKFQGSAIADDPPPPPPPPRQQQKNRATRAAAAIPRTLPQLQQDPPPPPSVLPQAPQGPPPPVTSAPAVQLRRPPQQISAAAFRLPVAAPSDGIAVTSSPQPADTRQQPTADSLAPDYTTLLPPPPNRPNDNAAAATPDRPGN